MSDHVLESRVWVAAARPRVFAFFDDPSNLARLTPPSLRFELLSPGPIVMGAGTVLDYRIRWLGLRLSGRAFIREYDPPVRFVDVQLRGPYQRWEHRHLFLEEAGGTWVEDRVTYALPLGPLGTLAHAVVVQRQLERLWDYRRRKLAEWFGPIRTPAA
jgi:ligand-binding SRPBCC domain-containing protein